MCLISGWGAHTGRGPEDPTNPQEGINQSLPPSPPPHPSRLPDDWAAGPHRGHHGDLQLCPDGDRDGHDQHVWIHLSWSCKWSALMNARLSWDGRHCIPHHITHGACSTILLHNPHEHAHAAITIMLQMLSISGSQSTCVVCGWLKHLLFNSIHNNSVYMGTPFHLQCTRTVTMSLGQVKSLLFVTVKFCYIVDARTIKYQENLNFGTARVSLLIWGFIMSVFFVMRVHCNKL